MTTPDLAGARAAALWTRLYTAFLREPARSDRRAEMASDVHEQIAAGMDAGLPEQALSRAIVERLLRGAFSDVAWRIQREVAREGVLTAGRIRAVTWVVLALAAVVWDAARGGLAPSHLAEGSTLVVRVVAAFLLAVSLASFVASATHPGRGFRARVRPRQVAAAFLSCSFAAAALWRDAPPPFDRVAAAAWAAFGVGLILTIGLLVGWVLRHIGRVRVALRKISS